MLRKSLNPVVIACFALSLGWPLVRARADIITDIDQLEKKPEVKKDPPVKSKPVKEKEKAPAPAAVERADIIPEPLEEIPAPAPSPSAVKSDGKTKGKSKEQRQKAPIHLQSDGTSTYSRDRSTVVLEKNVTITQDDMRLQSDEAKVALMPSGADGSGVKSALLDGKVSISRSSNDPSERMNAKSDKAFFDNQSQRVTLEGNARLWRDGSLIKGDKIIYEISTGIIKVDRAQGVVQPERMKK